MNNTFNIASCPHINNYNGFATHMTISDHPRLINQIPRGPKRYNEIKKLRSASERANSTLKEDVKVIEKPRVLNQERANILAQISAIVLLLKRACSFITRITMLFRKYQQNPDPKIMKKLTPPLLPAALRNLNQIE